MKPYLYLSLELCGGSEKDATYFYNFIANIFQKPTGIPPIAILFKGNKGTGKCCFRLYWKYDWKRQLYNKFKTK
jgi:hypothetical protein